jgi:hypothetical protein
MDHAETAAGEPRISPAPFLRRALEHRAPRGDRGGGQRGAKCGAAAAHDNDLEIGICYFTFSVRRRPTIISSDRMIFHYDSPSNKAQ